MTVTDQAPVVVGVDGSDQALTAVQAATREAAWRGRDLHIVHAFIWPLMHVNVGASDAVPDGGLRHDAERILAQAAGAAARTDAAVTVTTELVTGAASGVLLRAARRASLLVLGDRGLGGLGGLLLGSVAVYVSSHVDTPMLVVRGQERRPGPVVLGMDGSHAAAAAVEAAFVEAEQRGCDLLAVRVCHEPQAGIPSVARSYAADAAEECSSSQLCHPDVAVRQEVRVGPVTRTLVGLSEQAQLMVVGSRGCGGFTGLLRGSVSQQLLHHAACPVLVVRHARAPVRA
ncbi:universal stress protein [Dactylosporangium sp. NPDC005572]|uniref:universal stress protein n=1 Tax=Dactylosporangium sp. NPDC005572 TaxID=3156889 RepID=UPI0033BC4B73